MPCVKINLLLCCLAVSLATPFTRASTLTLATEDYPPFNMQLPGSPDVVGISTEKVQELMRRAGQDYSIKVYPWSRAYQMGQKEPDTCVYSTTRTPDREPLFKWVGPLVSNNWMIFARKDDERHPKSLEDLRHYILGVYRNDAVGNYLAQEGYTTEIANYDAENPRKLMFGRFDFWATGELLGLAILKKQGLSDKIVPLFQFKQTEMYLACQITMAQERVDKFNRILKDMDRDGTSAAIEKKYK